MPDAPPADVAEHARDFAGRYADALEDHAARTMLDLGIPPDKIGDGDPVHGIRHSAFNPHQADGGGVSPDGRITVDGGVMNPELLTASYGVEAAKRWAVRLRARLEAVIVHEITEYESGSHEEAL